MAIVNLVKSVGLGGENRSTEVTAITALLRQAGMGMAIPRDTSIPLDVLAKKIKAFQSMCGLGTGDGRVDPSGKTLRFLNSVANPVVFKPVTHPRDYSKGKDARKDAPAPSVQKFMSVYYGGYGLHFEIAVRQGRIPEPYRVYLGTESEPMAVELSTRNQARKTVSSEKKYGLMNQKLLVEMLKFFKKNQYWSQGLKMRLTVALSEDPEKGQSFSPPRIITQSNEQVLYTPVQPLNGKLLPLDGKGNGATLTYQGDPKTQKYWGRMLTKPQGFSKYLFIFSGELELNDKMRGFDCITYVGAACGAEHTKMKDSETLAEHLGATGVNHDKNKLEKSPAAKIKDFFLKKQRDNFVLWSGGHIVLVSKNKVHEFT